MSRGERQASVTIWTDVINYVRVRYEVLEDRGNWLRFRLGTADGRSQQVTVHHLPERDGTDWAEISSAVGWADKIDLLRLLQLAGEPSVGGAAVVDGVALIKDTVPLLSMPGFEHTLSSLAAKADAFERELSQSDEF